MYAKPMKRYNDEGQGSDFYFYFAVFGLLQKHRLFMEWKTWIHKVGFLIAEKDLGKIYK